jgi:hypothetical protein
MRCLYAQDSISPTPAAVGCVVHSIATQHLLCTLTPVSATVKGKFVSEVNQAQHHEGVLSTRVALCIINLGPACK